MLSERLRTLRRERGMTLEELADAVGTSRQNIHRYEKGVITNVPPERVEAIARALGVTPGDLMGWEPETAGTPDDGALPDCPNLFPVRRRRIPILGEIACGEPIFADEERAAFAEIDGFTDADFCLRAHGDSMIGARIRDGDLVFIRKQDEVENGEIAAVIIGDEATLKRVYFYPEEKKLILSPENPRFAPLVYMGSELETVKILGKAVAFQSALV